MFLLLKKFLAVTVDAVCFSDRNPTVCLHYFIENCFMKSWIFHKAAFYISRCFMPYLQLLLQVENMCLQVKNRQICKVHTSATDERLKS